MDAELFLLYCSIVSFQFHPGFKGARLTPEECVVEANYYYRAYVASKEAKEGLWPG